MKDAEFADYLVDNYITSESRYPPALWAEVPSNQKRTNNSTESFHAHFDEQFYSAHPAIFVFMDVLQKLQTTTYIKIRSTGKQVIPRKADRERTEYIISQYNKFTSGNINRREYLMSMGSRFLPK